MPYAKDVNNVVGNLVSDLITRHHNPTHFPRLELIEALTDPRMVT
jgi:hypothetical protein